MNTYIFIHGGESFSDRSQYIDWLTTTGVEWNQDPYSEKDYKRKWKEDMAQVLTRAGHLVYMPEFPSKQNAKYDEWKIFFDAWIRAIKIQGEVTLIGNSLGGCFLLKYFSEHTSLSGEIPLKEIHLIAACIEAGDFVAPAKYTFLQSLGDRVHIWHAEDDDVVDISVGHVLHEKIPQAVTHFFSQEKGYGHFHSLETFEELKNHLVR